MSDEIMTKLAVALITIVALHLSIRIAMKISSWLFGVTRKTSKKTSSAIQTTDSMPNKISNLSKSRKIAIYFIGTAVVILVGTFLVRIKDDANHISSPSFKNEPRGFRKVNFKVSPMEFLRRYPNAQSLKSTTFDYLNVYFVENEKFWDWDNVTVRFIFFENQLYSVAIDYAPIAVGSDIDMDSSDRAADLLMLSRAREYYGEPEIHELKGIRFYIWRGKHGAVTLDQTNNVLALLDSQLLLKVQARARKLGP